MRADYVRISSCQVNPGPLAVEQTERERERERQEGRQIKGDRQGARERKSTTVTWVKR